MRDWRGLVVALIGLLSIPIHAAFGATKLVPENNPTVVALNGQAISAYNRGDYNEALRLLDEIIARFPASGLGYANRGGVFFQIGKVDEAIRDYTQAIISGRNEAVVVLNRGTAYFAKGDYDKALEDCNAIIRINPRNHVAHRTCGVAYEKKGDIKQAFANFDEAIRLDSRDAKAYKARGLAYARLHQMEQAAADLAQAVRIDPALDKEAEVLQARENVKAALAGAAPPSATAGTPAAGTSAKDAPAATASASNAPNGETRVALVIGNSNYKSVPRLQNPENDANAVAEALRSTGFKTVQVANNLDIDGLRRALNDFSTLAANADWALVYYAGHGIEVNGTNYLIPTDAVLKTDRAVQFETVPLESVLASVEGAHKLHVVILDACRDNPFLRDMAKTVASRAVGRGLARIDPDTGATLVAYSAKAGQLAMDGVTGESNSPFANALVSDLQRPGVEIRKFFGLVRDDVMKATRGNQEPYVYGSLGGDDYFFRKP